MTRSEVSAAFLAIVLTTVGGQASADNGQVIKYLGPTVRTYDEHGQSSGEKPVKDLPRPPFPVERLDSSGHVVVLVGGRTFYFKASDLTISGGLVCKNLVVANKGYDTHVIAGPGVHAGAAENAVSCTH